MTGRHFSCGVWISVFILLYRSTANFSNSSTHQPMNVTLTEEEENTDWDSPFLQLRANLPSYSQPIRPYTLLTNKEDYRYMPQPRHRRPSRLLRLLGSSFDLFWMSIEKPSEPPGGQGAVRLLHGDTRLKEAAASHRQKLEKEAADLDLGSVPLPAVSSVRDWLVHSATCRLSYQWVDLGPAFWPRWLRQTDCETSDGERSCSFPSGMKCMRAQTAHVKILAWHCLEMRERVNGSKGIKAEKPEDRTETGSPDVMKRCVWRQVPYPVVTACACSCR